MFIPFTITGALISANSVGLIEAVQLYSPSSVNDTESMTSVEFLLRFPVTVALLLVSIDVGPLHCMLTLTGVSTSGGNLKPQFKVSRWLG